MSQILHLLNQARPDHTVSSQQIWDRVPEYDEGRASGRRLYRMDVAALEARGLIRTGVTTPAIPNRQAVVGRFVGKPADFHLTEAEHRAVRHARRLVAAHGPVPVTDGPAQHGGAAFDLLLTAVRILEEHGDEMTLAELSTELRREPADVVFALHQGWMLESGPDNDEVLGDLDIQYDEGSEENGQDNNEGELWSPDVPDRDWARADPKRVLVRVLKPVGKVTLLNSGLSALGRFAYTREETAERLAVIARALSERPAGLDRAVLTAAERKLRGWAAQLERQGD
jgi:hypothetical protein